MIHLKTTKKTLKKFDWRERKMEKNDIKTEKPRRKGLFTQEDIVVEKEIPKEEIY